MRGPRSIASASADPTAGGVDDTGTGEVDRAVAEVQALTQVREPTAAPHPHAEHGVDQRAHADLGEDERGERDPLGDRADDDVARGLHEDDLEQEEHHDADVVAAAGLQEEAVRAEHARRCRDRSAR